MFETGKRIQQILELMKTQQKESETNQKKRTEQSDRIAQNLMETAQAVQKHDMAIADMLDTWEEWREELSSQWGSMQERQAEQARDEAEAIRKQADAFLGGMITACDQLFLLRKAAENARDIAWSRQIGLAEAEVHAKALQAGLQITGKVGEVFSYDLHEPIERIESDHPEQHMTLAKVYSQGYWIQGRLLRKAQVAVWLHGPEDA